jgi:LysM repeat protein
MRPSSLQASSSEPWTPATLPRRGPSHPDWEKPPTQYDYPELRGRESHRTLWPLVAAALGAVLVIGVLVVIPSLFGHGNNASVASASTTPAATDSSGAVDSSSPVPGGVVSASPGIVVTPGPSGNFTQYTVQAGDTLTKIAIKYQTTRAKLMALNPKIPSNFSIRIGQVLTVPALATPSPSPSAQAT